VLPATPPSAFEAVTALPTFCEAVKSSRADVVELRAVPVTLPREAVPPVAFEEAAIDALVGAPWEG
jgi:lysozyme family protein